MHCLEFKKRLNSLNEKDKKYVYTLTLMDAVNYLNDYNFV